MELGEKKQIKQTKRKKPTTSSSFAITLFSYVSSGGDVKIGRAHV
jgi:hypothetical protein